MKKNVDKKNRWRSVIVSFRMSQAESDDLNMRVKLSGLTKQDYIIKRLSEQDIVVQPNTRVFKALRNQMTDILSDLSRLQHCSDISDELLDIIRLVAQTYNELDEKKKS